jgi:hypothetical protein
MGVKFNPFTGNLDLIDTTAAAGADTQVQYNNGGSLAGSADLTWDDTAKELGVGGDINLDDGGTYETTVQVVTPTANRTISFPDATGTVALVAGSSGQLTYNNAGAQAGLTSANIGSTGQINVSLAGAASTPPVTFTGSWYTGGTATTTKPQLLIEPSGTTSTAWSTSGTGLGVNAASGFSGRLLDLQTNGTSRMVVQGDGKLLVGTSSARTVGGTSRTVQIEGLEEASLSAVRNSNDNGNSALVLGKSRGTAIGAATVVQANDTIGRVIFSGADGTSLIQAGFIECAVDSTPGANDMPGRLVFSTTADGAASPTERVRLTNNGALLVGTTSTPTGAGSGAVVAQNRIVVGAGNNGLSQTIAGSTGSATATTGTVVFRFACSTPTSPRAGYVKIAISQRTSSSSPSNLPAAEYAFQLHNTSAGVCTLNGATTIFEYVYVRATHFAFADLGSGECTVTLTNPTALSLTGSYSVQILTDAGTWGLSSVTVT